MFPKRHLQLCSLLVVGLLMLLVACGPRTPSTDSRSEPLNPAVEAGSDQLPSEELGVSEDIVQQPTAFSPSANSEFHGAFPYQVPPVGHLNSYISNGIPNGLTIYWSLLELPGAMYQWGDGKWRPLLAESWEMVPPDKFVLHLREGVRWSDGTTFKAQDVVNTFSIGRLFKWTIFNYVDDIKATDDYTVEFHMVVPSTVVERYVLGVPYRAHQTYGHIAARVEQLRQAGYSEESEDWKAVLQEATNYRPETLLVTGPFNIDIASITEAQLTLVKNPNSYLANQVRFDKVLLFNGETPSVTPLVLAGDIDYATHGFPPATERAFVDAGIRIIRAPTYTGPAIFFNHSLYPLNRPELRQAIAYAIDRDQNGTVSLGDSGRAVQYMAGFSDNLVPLWMRQPQIDALNPYAFDVGKGEELLTSIGFTKDSDGIWIDDQGKRLEFELTVPPDFSDWLAAAENLSDQLKDFGIAITVRGIEFQQHVSDVDNGDFQMAILPWGSGSNPHPHFSFRQNLFIHNYVVLNEGRGMDFPLQQQIEGQMVDFEALVVGAAAGLNQEAQQDNVVSAAIAFNALLPIIPLWERYGNNPIVEGRVSSWPPDSDPLYKNAVYGDNFTVMWIIDGTLGPKQ